MYYIQKRNVTIADVLNQVYEISISYLSLDDYLKLLEIKFNGRIIIILIVLGV